MKAVTHEENFSCFFVRHKDVYVQVRRKCDAEIVDNPLNYILRRGT